MTHYMEHKMGQWDIPPIPEFIEMIADTGAGLHGCKASCDLFGLAKDDLIDQVKEDRSILAAVLCGSLSHDKVWDKSDVDLVLITIDDNKLKQEGVSLNADGVSRCTISIGHSSAAVGAR